MSTPEMPAQPAEPAPSTPPALPTPPPHPYTGDQPRRGDNRLAISAMAVGLLALLTTIVVALYSAALIAVGVVLAIIASGLGIAALILKQRPIALAVVGLASGVVSFIIAIVVGALLLGGAVVDAVDAGSDDTDADQPQTSQSIDAKWPANMATGGVIFLGGDPVGGEVVRSVAPPKGSEPFSPTTAASGDESSAHRIQLYVDYMCPACGVFEKTNLDTIEAALASGDTSLELRPLTFLDAASNGSYYSSRASGALACVVSEQPALAWKTHTALLDTDHQPAEGTSGPDNQQLIKTIDAATGGLSDQTRSCITEETYVPFAQGLSAWLLNNPVPQAKDPSLMVSGTPTVLVNGVRYEGSISDAAAFKSFLKEQGVTVK